MPVTTRRPGSVRRRLAIAGLTLALAVPISVLGPTAAAADSAAPPVGERVGIGASSRLLWEDDVSRQTELDAIAATGARWTSVDVDWPSIQPDGPDAYDWSVTDRVVREAADRDLRIIGVIAYAPRWAVGAHCPRDTTHCLPVRDEDFARIAKSAALRYGSHSYDPALRGTVAAWQIWNEPNHFPFVQPSVDVARYTTLLRYAYREIKRVDTMATVIAGATSPAPDDPSGRDVAPLTFLEGIYAHGGGDSFDAFSHHPYSFPCSPLVNKPWNAFMQTYWLHQALVRHGDGDRRIWGTEVGAPTGADVGTCAGGDGVSVTEADQQRVMIDAIRAWTQTFGRFTGPLLWFSIRDGGTDPQNYDDHFGLLRRDFSPKPAYRGLEDLLARPDPLAAVGAPDPGPARPPHVAPEPVPAPGTVVSECLGRGVDLTIAGDRSDRATPDLPAAAVVDARTARWVHVDPWPVSVTGRGAVCWVGGTIAGTYPTDTPWETFHHTGAFNIANPDSIVEGVRVHDYGDAFNLRDGAERFTIRGAHTSNVHDDCVQDDHLTSGAITDSLFDGCYVGISTRPSSNDTSSDGRGDRIVLDGSLLRLAPMPTVYKGPAPGTGGFFKWDQDAGRSPTLVLHDDVLRADQAPNHGSLGLPEGYDVECSGVTIVWLGPGSFPGAASWRSRCPDTRIVTDVSVWDDAVRAWVAAHAG